MILETSMPRVFAVGDVREGSTKRVASGVGEGSVVVEQIHRLLESEGAERRTPTPHAEFLHQEASTTPNAAI